MEPRVAQHDQTGERGEIPRHEVVAPRVAELIDDKVVGIAARLPHEVAGVGPGEQSIAWADASRGTRSAL